MESYKILLKTSVVREYEAIHSDVDRRRVIGKIAGLSADPRPTDSTTVPERVDLLRIYLLNYRLIYHVNERKKQVTVFRIAHRRCQDTAW